MKFLPHFICLLLINLFHSGLKSQCTIQYDGSLCRNSEIIFTGSIAGSTHDFDFNGEGTATGQRIVKFRFKTPGEKTIQYITTTSGTKCSTQIKLKIQESPQIKLTAISPFSQCFENNLYCFLDSTKNTNGSKISSCTWDINDGQRFIWNQNNLGETKCFSFKDDRGGNIWFQILVEDENGCQARDTINPAGTVYAKIMPRFTGSSSGNPSCDSQKVTVTNISSIRYQDTQSVLWIWGDGTTSNGFGPTKYKTYYKEGVFNIKLIIKSNKNCTDSFTKYAAVTNYSTKGRIIASADSVCASNSKIGFQIMPPMGTSSFLWIFGDPLSGPLNFNNRELNPTHTFTTAGPVQVKLSYSHPVCGNRILYDTLKVLGPVSIIESAGNRIPEFEVFQCVKERQDPVHFKNLSKFYHNDKNLLDEDSLVWVNGVPKYVFDNQQIALKSKNYKSSNRGNSCVKLLWDFGDEYASKCTTNTAENIHPFSNCRYSEDSLPVHAYTSWDKILYDKYKREYMEQGVFDEKTRLCSILKVYPSDSFVVVNDTTIGIPGKIEDTALYSGFYPSVYRKEFSGERWFIGIGKRYIDFYSYISIDTGKQIYVTDAKGNLKVVNGPISFPLYKGDIIENKNATDTAEFLFCFLRFRDTLPMNIYKEELKKGHNLEFITAFKANFSGVPGTDYVVDYVRYKQLFYSKIPQLFQASLSQKDECNGLKCESKAFKNISVMNPDAGSFGVGIKALVIPCMDLHANVYNVTFLSKDLKPGGSFSYFAINKDSNCGNTFIPLTGLIDNSKPGYLPYSGYNLDGNPGNAFSTMYSPSDICTKNGCATVGVIIGNGVSKSGSRPMCADTQYYPNLVCFPKWDANFDLFGAKTDGSGNQISCKGRDLYVAPAENNYTKPEEISKLIYSFNSTNVGPGLKNYWKEYIEEKYYRNEIIKDSGSNKLYNYLVISRYSNSPHMDNCGFMKNENSDRLLSKSDTIITGIIYQWDTAVSADKVWESFSGRIKNLGLDPYSFNHVQLNKLIWNGKGIPGVAGAGSMGCLDTSGIGNLLNYRIIPKRGNTRIIHERDTSIVPMDSFVVNNVWKQCYRFNTSYNGYYLAELKIISKDENCEKLNTKPVIVGFAGSEFVPDSIIGKNSQFTVPAKVSFKYIHPDPINFGMFDPYDYWSDPVRNMNSGGQSGNYECEVRWDWNKSDDDTANPNTIFGGAPHGGRGLGTPWKDLGGGGLSSVYYKDTGIYQWRVTTCDSNKCADTFGSKIIVTGVSAKFGVAVNVPVCNLLLEFMDSAELYDPCRWANKNCSDPEARKCDFITQKIVDWGDGVVNKYSRALETEELMPTNLAHLYKKRGTFRIAYIVKSMQNAVDSSEIWITVNGAIPNFRFDKTQSHDTSVYVGDSVYFVNQTTGQTPAVDYTWFFGDGKMYNGTSNNNVGHLYTSPGVYQVYLQTFDSLVIPPYIYKYCPDVFPDTPWEKSYTVYVNPLDNVQNLKSGSKVGIYPNPAGNWIAVRGLDHANLSLYAMDGRFIRSNSGSSMKMDISDLVAGIYLIQVMDGEGVEWNFHFIKQ
ncbi:MAG: T9SS type A sorting domain-containing protein [Bacteroidetes bacterium]|nr:T9SS type A sorting domain-containing protein [Bacteroidota bacterium]